MRKRHVRAVKRYYFLPEKEGANAFLFTRMNWFYSSCSWNRYIYWKLPLISNPYKKKKENHFFYKKTKISHTYMQGPCDQILHGHKVKRQLRQLCRLAMGSAWPHEKCVESPNSNKHLLSLIIFPLRLDYINMILLHMLIILKLLINCVVPEQEYRYPT